MRAIRSLAAPALRAAVMPTQARAIPALLQTRWASGSTQDRVIASVKRYVEVRKDDLIRDTDNTTPARSEVLKALESEVSLETKWDDLKFDDLDKVEVLLEVEEEFNHVIGDTDADGISSVKEVIDYLEKAQVK
mmetsp:Transcript_39491/g.73628  ORF Transcript_39491/g.73628 Transcript_39491/m.73628 type:complete len:134 (+) Transcript_39491:88-489(+)